MKIILSSLLFFSAISFSISSSFGQNLWSSEYVYYGDEGKLCYTPDSLGNIIPDFSHVGYMNGDEAIPDIEVKIEVLPVDGDDGASIQAAIDSISKLEMNPNGFRGAVLLKKGIYQIEGSVFINKSGIIFRGEGEGEDGTVIIASGTGDRPLIKIGIGTSMSLDYGSVQNINEEYVPVGRKYLILDNASGFQPDDVICVYRPGTNLWFSDLKMDQIPNDGDVVQWTASGYNFKFERKISKISGDTIFFRNPVVMAMETKYGGGKVYKASWSRLSKIGVENMLLKSEYTSDTDEAHSWDAIKVYGVENGWIRNVTAKYFAYSIVNLQESAKNITVSNCTNLEPKSIITGGRRYSYNCNGEQNLFTNCYASKGRHDFVNGSRVKGPNVFVNSRAENAYADIGPHHRWAMGTLFDNIVSDGEINVQDRASYGTGHGWAGANMVFWNNTGKSSICQNPWVSANNYNFGFMGKKDAGDFPPKPDGVWVGHNKAGIFPNSLYYAQLDERLNNAVKFSVYPLLRAVSDSVYVIKFNFPVNEILASNKDNYTLGGSSGVGDKSFEISVINEKEIEIIIHEIGILEAFSRIEITADNIMSVTGDTISAINTAYYIEPDKTPVVSSANQTVSNAEGNFVIATSSKKGRLYLVNSGIWITDAEDLINAEINGKAISVEVLNPGEYVSIFVNSLIKGRYYFYAVDDFGRMSGRGTGIVTVTDDLTSISESPGENSNFVLINNSSNLIINSEDSNEYNVLVYSITGELLLYRKNLTGRNEFKVESVSGIKIVKIISENEVRISRIF
ncbi:MAG: hypothetical protein K9H49_18430 [Bacteroidales bacterium]|nr:hypothetical protein [Bacteroidales bacterium]MCF8392114.1 hypothetical protein [Bacteroidales bacterium]